MLRHIDDGHWRTSGGSVAISEDEEGLQRSEYRRLIFVALISESDSATSPVLPIGGAATGTRLASYVGGTCLFG